MVHESGHSLVAVSAGGLRPPAVQLSFGDDGCFLGCMGTWERMLVIVLMIVLVIVLVLMLVLPFFAAYFQARCFGLETMEVLWDGASKLLALIP